MVYLHDKNFCIEKKILGFLWIMITHIFAHLIKINPELNLPDPLS